MTNNASFSHSDFCLSGELSAICIKFEIVVCKLFEFGRDQNMWFEEGLSSTNFGCVANAFSLDKVG